LISSNQEIKLYNIPFLAPIKFLLIPLCLQGFLEQREHVLLSMGSIN